MRSTGKGISLAGAIAALICFFLPWFTVSCGNLVTTRSGWQMAAGTTIETTQGPQEYQADFILIMAFLAAIGALILSVVGMFRTGSPFWGISILGAGVLGTLILLFKFATNQTDTSGDVDVFVEYHAGFFGTALGYLLIIIGGVLDMIGMRRKESP